jgi:hypothetical protein
MKKVFLTLSALASLMLASGCMTTKTESVEEPPPVPMNVFNFEGIPAQDYYIGGGFIIRYRAHEDGILYIAESESARLLGTISMTSGEKYEMVYDINDEDMVVNMKAVGINPEKALIKVFFVPKTNF